MKSVYNTKCKFEFSESGVRVLRIVKTHAALQTAEGFPKQLFANSYFPRWIRNVNGDILLLAEAL
jgi:hypothetical protein